MRLAAEERYRLGPLDAGGDGVAHRVERTEPVALLGSEAHREPGLERGLAGRQALPGTLLEGLDPRLLVGGAVLVHPHPAQPDRRAGKAHRIVLLHGLRGGAVEQPPCPGEPATLQHGLGVLHPQLGAWLGEARPLGDLDGVAVEPGALLEREALDHRTRGEAGGLDGDPRIVAGPDRRGARVTGAPRHGVEAVDVAQHHDRPGMRVEALGRRQRGGQPLAAAARAGT